MQGTHHGDVIHAAGKVRKNFRDFHPALPVPGKLEGAAHVHPLLQASINAGDGSAVVLGQNRLGVEGVHLAGSAGHEEEDAGLGLGSEMGSLGSQRVPRRDPLGQQAVPGQHVGQGGPSDPSAHTEQEVPAPHFP